MTPEKFWSYVWKPPEPAGCWIWMGSKTIGKAGGYGRFKENKVAYRAHRFALELYLGRKLKKNEQANHKCNNRLCVRIGPGHVYQGDAKTNMRDAKESNRLSVQQPTFINPWQGRCGMKSPVAKLTDEKIRLIRELRKQGFSQQAIADKVGSTQINVSVILRGKTWKHIY